MSWKPWKVTICWLWLDVTIITILGDKTVFAHKVFLYGSYCFRHKGLSLAAVFSGFIAHCVFIFKILGHVGKFAKLYTLTTVQHWFQIGSYKYTLLTCLVLEIDFLINRISVSSYKILHIRSLGSFSQKQLALCTVN